MDKTYGSFKEVMTNGPDYQLAKGNSWIINIPFEPIHRYKLTTIIEKMPAIYYDKYKEYIYTPDYSISELYKYLWITDRFSLVNHIINLGLNEPIYKYIDLYKWKSLIGPVGNLKGNVGKLMSTLSID
jgi:hypothetical protein